MQNINNIKRFLAFAFILVFAASSCEIQDSFEYKPSGVDGKLDVSAWKYVEQNDSTSLLREAIVHADLTELFDGNSTERTFIIPSNRAFRAYLKANAYSSVQDIPLPILRNMLKYHVVNARVIFTDPSLMPSNKPISYKTENGQTMFLSHGSNFVGIINEGTSQSWQINTSNLEPTNGVIHMVNSVVYFSVPTGDLNVNPNLTLDTIYPIHDAYVNGGAESTKNFGSNPLLRIKHISHNGDYDRKAFLMFDLDHFKKEGVVTDMRFQISVSFTHGKGLPLDLFETANTTWSESSLNFSNAVFPQTPRIATVTTKSGVPAFNFDLTDYYKARTNHAGRVSFMLEGAKGADETNDLASKEHATLKPPMLIATLASGNSSLEIAKQSDVTVGYGEVFVFNNNILEVTGAAAADVIYTIESVPQNGWLIKGASTLRKGDKFTQLDIELMNLLFIHNGASRTSDEIVLTARDRAGAIIKDIKLKVSVQ